MIFFGIEIIIIYKLKKTVYKVAFQFQNHLILKKIHCAFLQLITLIVGMRARAPKMYTLGTYYNIIDTHIKLQ